MAVTNSVCLLLLLLAASRAREDESNEEDEEDERLSADALLKKIIPYGKLPTMPDGFPRLENLTTDRFDVKAAGHTTVLTSELDQPVGLLGDSMKLEDVSMTFRYKDKRRKKGRWEFHAQGKWNHGNMSARVRIEESKVGNHHTMIASTSKLNLLDLSMDIAEKDSVKHAGISLDLLKKLNVQNVEMYSVFKGKGDYVFMMSGEPNLQGIKASDCKVFIRRSPKKKDVFSILLEFEKELPSRVLLQLISDDMFKIPFINHLIAKTHIFRTSPTNFGFVASTGSIDKIPLKSFGGGILSDELGSHVSKGLTLLLPIHLGSKNNKPVKVAMIIALPKVKFITAKHENVSIAQTLQALSPTSKIKGVPSGFPNLKTLNVNHFSYDINQEAFTVSADVTKSFPIIPTLLNTKSAHVMFRHHVGDAFDTWMFDATILAQFGGSDVKLTLSTDEDIGIMFVSGRASGLSIRSLAAQYGLSFIPDEESRALIENSKMQDFVFSKPLIRSAMTQEQKNKYIHITGQGKFPRVNKYIDAEAVVYEDEGKMKTAVGFTFSDISVDYMVNALTGFETSKLSFLSNSFNTSLILSTEKTVSLFDNPTLERLSFEKGLSLVSLFKFPSNCSGNKICNSAQRLLELERLYRLQGLIKQSGTSLVGNVMKNYMLGDGLVLSNNVLKFDIGMNSSMSVKSRMSFDKENVAFYGAVEFRETGVNLNMKSNDSLIRYFGGGVLSLNDLQFHIPLLNSLPLTNINMSARITLGAVSSRHKLSTTSTIEYVPRTPEYSHMKAKFSNISLQELIKAFDIQNASIPKLLSSTRFSDDLVARYAPGLYVVDNFTFDGSLQAFGQSWDCSIKPFSNNGTNQLYIISKKLKSPIVLERGLITLQDSQLDAKSGPNLLIEIGPNETEYKLVSFARLLGLGSQTNVEISNSGTGFLVYGSLFNMPPSGLLLSSHDVLGSSTNSTYKVYGCLPGIYGEVTVQVENMVHDAAMEAENFVTQANVNLNEAKEYYRRAAKNEEVLRDQLRQEKVMVKKREREAWLTQERYNNSCELDSCVKACIGCPDWNRCCSHDVFGSCVQCPSWNKCCYKSNDPVCMAHNHGCQHIRKVARGNVLDAKDILKDAQSRLESLNMEVFDAEFAKGKTKAVLDAAAKALSLIDRDSALGIKASKALRQFGISNVVNISSVCFATPVQTLATGCVDMQINATMIGVNRSLGYSGCLNKELVPKMAHFVANIMFPNIDQSKHSRSVLSEEKPQQNNANISRAAPSYVKHVTRRERRESSEAQQIEPFWDMLPNYDPLRSTTKKNSHNSRVPLKKTWKIPASREGKCRIYNQLLDICKDMVKTVKKMFGSYMYEKFMYKKQKAKFERNLKQVAAKLEKAAKSVAGTESQMQNIERALDYLSEGVQKWEKRCNQNILKQNEIGVRAWIRTMDERIKSLGGEGVVRFQKNLFRAFDELFESGNVPSKQATKAVTVLQRVRRIRQAFEDLFEKKITLVKANRVAVRVLYDIQELRDEGIYCKP